MAQVHFLEVWLLLPQYVQDKHSCLWVCAVDVQHSTFSTVGGLPDCCPYMASLDFPVVCHHFTLLFVTLAGSTSACPSRFFCPVGTLDERLNVSVGLMVHSPEESGLYVFGLFDPRCLGQHRSDEDHGSLTVPA